MCWVMGNSVVYDGLGHSPRSYYSASRRQLLCNEVSWLLNWKRREAAAKGAAEVNPSSTQRALTALTLRMVSFRGSSGKDLGGRGNS
ncbi:glycosyl hydrolase [Cutibacterium acnes JCM 18920]|nr:glycosyl hydrolase [Cutibacterium acnes JCM 18920]